jgi:hypothetical protein
MDEPKYEYDELQPAEESSPHDRDVNDVEDDPADSWRSYASEEAQKIIEEGLRRKKKGTTS